MKRRLYKIPVMVMSIFAAATNLVSQTGFDYSFLADQFDAVRLHEMPLKEIKSDDIARALSTLKKDFPKSFGYEVIGRSIQGRPIHLVRLGEGDVKILLWSQMHGDEPTATAALFDVFHYLLKHEHSPFVRDILKNMTILAVPMLNPDGAEKFKRRNAQGLDVNRDARDQQSPEGQLLYRLQQTHRPDFGFNLHDQNARRTVGKTSNVAAIALMAPPFDEGDSDNPVRIRAKKIVSVIYEALGPYLYGHVSKYDADYMPRSFGDSMQNWGVSTVLIESGGWYEGRDAFLEKMNFIAMLASFHAIATGGYERANPALYDLLPENGVSLYDMIFRDVTVLDGTGIPAFRTDVAVNYDADNTGRIADMGDLDVFAAKDTIPGEDLCLTPGLVGLVQGVPPDDRKLIDRTKKMTEQGYTTVLFSFTKEQIEKTVALAKSADDGPLPANVGGVLYLDGNLSSDRDTLEVLKCLGGGAVGILGTGSTLKEDAFSEYTQKPAVPLSDAESVGNLESLDPEHIKKLTGDRAGQWKIPQRGEIRIGQVADVVLFDLGDPSGPVVNTVFIKGHAVWRKGEWLTPAVGGERWLPK